MKSKGIIKNLWLIFLLLGVITALLAWVAIPHGRETQSVLGYFFQIAAFILILMGIGIFPRNFKLNYLLMNLPVVFLIMYVIPKISYYESIGNHNRFYFYEFALLYPLIIFSICFAYRIGGGIAGKCIKIGLNGLILLFSGLLDLMWFVVNGINFHKSVISIPHIEVFLGHSPSIVELMGFIAIHLIIITIINLLPFDRWMEHLIFSDQKGRE